MPPRPQRDPSPRLPSRSGPTIMYIQTESITLNVILQSNVSLQVTFYVAVAETTWRVVQLAEDRCLEMEQTPSPTR